MRGTLYETCQVHINTMNRDVILMLYKNDQKQKYHVLVRGVILSGEFLLVAHCLGMDNTFLPGGHVEFREGIRSSLSREIFEELGFASEVGKYLGAVEAEFENGVYHQEKIRNQKRVILSFTGYI